MRTFDQEVAYQCAHPFGGGPGWAVAPGTKECGGLLAILVDIGIDQHDLYLFDSNTRLLVETMGPGPFSETCTGSATGVDLTQGPTFTAADAAQWLTFPIGDGPPSGGCWDVQPSCNGACPGFGNFRCPSFAPPQTEANPSETLDQALAYACAHPQEVDGAAVAPCVFSCNGFIGLAAGSDTANVELFDPSTRQLAEVGSAADGGGVSCACSTSGVPAQCTVPQGAGCMANPCGDAGTASGDASSE